MIDRRQRDPRQHVVDVGDLIVELGGRRVLGSVPPLGLRNGDADWETEPLAAAALRDIAARVLADPKHELPQAVEDSLPVFDHAGRPASLARRP
jgi:hypothetical protein